MARWYSWRSAALRPANTAPCSSCRKGGTKRNSLQIWHAGKQTLSPLCVARNAWLAYLATGRQELEALPQNIYRWDKENLCPSG